MISSTQQLVILQILLVVEIDFSALLKIKVFIILIMTNSVLQHDHTVHMIYKDDITVIEGWTLSSRSNTK